MITAIFFLLSESVNLSFDTNLLSSFLIVDYFKREDKTGNNSRQTIANDEPRLLFGPTWLFSVGRIIKYSIIGRIAFEIGLGMSNWLSLYHKIRSSLPFYTKFYRVTFKLFNAFNLFDYDKADNNLKRFYSELPL